jgi:steroid delta-isomerase-like uncharacterized protein
MSENKVVVTRWAEEALNQGKLDVIDELFADEFTWEMPFSAEPLHGPQAMKKTVATFLAAFSDFHVEVAEVLGEGDKVALKYTASGTNDGEFQGAPPTGRHASWYVQHMFTVRDGKIIADVTVLDRRGLLEQLGLVTATAAAGQ